MATPIYQYALYFLHSKSGDGWQEIITWKGGGASIFDQAVNWAQQRIPFLAIDCYIIGWSRRRIDGTKDSTSYLFSEAIQGTWGLADQSGAGAVNEPGNTVEFEVYSANRANRRCFYFRGIDDSWIKGDNLTPAGSGALPLVEAYLTWIKGGVGGMRVQSNPWLDMTSLANTAPVGGSPLQAVAIGLDGQVAGKNGNIVFQTKSLRGYPYLNGRWVGYSNGVNSVVLGSASGRYTANVIGSGSIRVVAPDVAQIDSWFFARVGNHKTGLPFGVLRGRKSKKVLHR